MVVTAYVISLIYEYSAIAGEVLGSRFTVMNDDNSNDENLYEET